MHRPTENRSANTNPYLAGASLARFAERVLGGPVGRGLAAGPRGATAAARRLERLRAWRCSSATGPGSTPSLPSRRWLRPRPTSPTVSLGITALVLSLIAILMARWIARPLMRRLRGRGRARSVAARRWRRCPKRARGHPPHRGGVQPDAGSGCGASSRTAPACWPPSATICARRSPRCGCAPSSSPTEETRQKTARHARRDAGHDRGDARLRARGGDRRDRRAASTWRRCSRACVHDLADLGWDVTFAERRQGSRIAAGRMRCAARSAT